ncbi:MAG TPA: MFS transporter [Clostridia bacterium]|nr:MFS transporter [Clostridia bacterium]
MKLDYRKTILIGFGFFAINIIWSIYNVAVPIYLKGLGLAGVTIGAIMAVDNIFALILQPVFGLLSDKTVSRYGRRMPFLLIGIPLAALSFLVIPFFRSNAFLLLTAVFALNFFMSIFRSPTFALVPDLTPKNLRNVANGVINTMGAIGATTAFLLGGILFRSDDAYPFAVASGILFISVIITYAFIKEPAAPNTEPDEKEPDEKVLNSSDKKGNFLNLIFMMLAIFFWFAGYNAFETFFSTYGQAVLEIDKSLTSFMLMAFSMMFIIAAISSRFISKKYSRKKTILSGLCILIGSFVLMIFIKNTVLLFLLLAVSGICWALININSYPMVMEMTNSKSIGRHTGLYFFFSMVAGIISPILYGNLKDHLGEGFLFIYSCIAFVIALFFIMLVNHGETLQDSSKAVAEK